MPTVEKLQLLTDTIFELEVPLPIPASFLIDKRGRVVAVYKGPVTVDQLLADAAKLKVRTTDEWRAATLPVCRSMGNAASPASSVSITWRNWPIEVTSANVGCMSTKMNDADDASALARAVGQNPLPVLEGP